MGQIHEWTQISSPFFRWLCTTVFGVPDSRQSSPVEGGVQPKEDDCRSGVGDEWGGWKMEGVFPISTGRTSLCSMEKVEMWWDHVKTVEGCYHDRIGGENDEDLVGGGR
jgi:hypothetical protein